MAKSLYKCHLCPTMFLKENGQANRAKKKGSPMFCGRPCLVSWRKDHVFTGGGRKPLPFRTEEQKKQDKRDYDKDYRAKNRALKKAKKKAYYQKNKEKIEAKMKLKRQTLEFKLYRKDYLKSDKYKNYKHEYDREYRCKKYYGEFWEAASILIDIENHLIPHRYAIRLQAGTFNKAKQRKRDARERGINVKCS